MPAPAPHARSDLLMSDSFAARRSIQFRDERLFAGSYVIRTT